MPREFRPSPLAALDAQYPNGWTNAKALEPIVLVAGQWGWTIIRHDYSHHLEPNELSSIKRHGEGVFYLWGAEGPNWEKLRCLARAYDRIVHAEANTPRPFLYWVTETGLPRGEHIP